MARKKANSPLMVYLNGRLVGRFRRETSGAVDFQYDAAWLAWENAIPASLSLPLREDRYIGAPVIAVFDNLLPDNEAIRGRVAARVRALPQGGARGHGRPHAEPPRLIAGRGDHAARSGVAYGDGAAAQGGIIPLLHRGEEGVHIHMDDLARCGDVHGPTPSKRRTK